MIIDPPPIRRISHFMDIAIRNAKKSIAQNRHGCVIVSKKRILGEGWNQSKTHPVAKFHFTQCIHAEVSAMIGVNRDDFVGADLFVCRLYFNDAIGMSKPCKHCATVIKKAGIKRVYYTGPNGIIKLWRL